MEVIHTPGHTPGHCAFYFPGERILFTADLDLVKAGPYYGDLGSDLEDTITSLNRLKSYPCDFYLTGHGKGVYEGDPTLIDQYIDCIYRREEALVEFLRLAPHTIEEIAGKGIIYGPKKSAGVVWDFSLTEQIMMEKHVEYLLKRSVIHQDGKHFVLNSR